MIWKLLKRNISAAQILGYAVANLVGLAIVLSAVKFYGDVSEAITGNDPLLPPDYLIISKPVTAMNTIGVGRSTTFSQAEINDISAQEWAQSVGRFTAADFHVSANVDFQGRGLSTFLFLEAIPDEFIDITSDEWTWTPESTELPIIMSKDYLALYNFGFAASRGLPQISEGLVGAVPLNIMVAGNGRADIFPARIVGFSSRLNTIAVPQNFIDYANNLYGKHSAIPDPSRLIIKVTTPGDPAISAYFNSHGIEVAGDKADAGRAGYFLQLLTSIVVAIGAVISLLAFFVLMLSIFLIMQKSRHKIHDLLLLGYSPAMVARVYFALIGIVNASVLILAIGAMLIASRLWIGSLSALNMTATSPWPAIIVGVIIMATVTAANFITIYRHIRRNF